MQHKLSENAGHTRVVLEKTNFGDFGDRGTTSGKNGALSSHKGEATWKNNIKNVITGKQSKTACPYMYNETNRLH